MGKTRGTRGAGKNKDKTHIRTVFTESERKSSLDIKWEAKRSSEKVEVEEPRDQEALVEIDTRPLQ